MLNSFLVKLFLVLNVFPINKIYVSFIPHAQDESNTFEGSHSGTVWIRYQLGVNGFE